MTKPSVMIATPMYGGMCTAGYTLGLLKTFAVMQQMGVEMDLAYLTSESLITRARNELVRIFLERNSHYLMFVDADIQFDEASILQLMAANKDIVCGLYPKKEIDWPRVQKAAQDGKQNIKDYSGAYVLSLPPEAPQTPVLDEQGLFEIRHGGTGFMLIRRNVFEKLKPHVPTYRMSGVKDAAGNHLRPLTHEFFATSIDDTGTLLSEDYHFCDLWRKHGGQIFANPAIKLDHVGNYVYSGNFMEAGGNLK